MQVVGLNCDSCRHGATTSRPFSILDGCDRGSMRGIGTTLAKCLQLDKTISCRELFYEYNIIIQR